jgi:hypothetical protein
VRVGKNCNLFQKPSKAARGPNGSTALNRGK